jgi:hypothetical protein
LICIDNIGRQDTGLRGIVKSWAGMDMQRLTRLDIGRI